MCQIKSDWKLESWWVRGVLRTEWVILMGAPASGQKRHDIRSECEGHDVAERVGPETLQLGHRASYLLCTGERLFPAECASVFSQNLLSMISIS